MTTEAERERDASDALARSLRADVLALGAERDSLRWQLADRDRQITALREGLAFYADEHNYADSVQTVEPAMPGLGPIQYDAPSVMEDNGARACALLAQPAGEGAVEDVGNPDRSAV